ncbi:MAG: hypothetical protein ABJA10_02805 [Aestuariivirga sp.]
MSQERPTLERLKKAGEEIEDRVVNTGGENEPDVVVVQMLDGSALDMLFSRGTITGDQYAAGVRFYGDWYYAGLGNSGVVDPTRVQVDGGTHKAISDRVLDSADRYKRAKKALGIVHSYVLVCILIEEEKLQDFGRKAHRRVNIDQARLAATASLRDALTALDYHYYGQRNTKGGTYHTDDYRPEILPADTPS